jgi:hypothetical protein
MQPALDEKEIYGVYPKPRNEQYDMMEIINRLVDNPKRHGQNHNSPELTGRNCRETKNGEMHLVA